jgi:HPt (histidine-containing phosphotransfer) domain-containing protein
MFGGDIEHFQMILEIFNRTMPDDFGELKQAMADGNWPIAKGLAHKIKPSFQMIGLGYMTKNVQELEAALDNASDLNLIKDLFDIFLKNVQKALHITAEQESYFRQTV